ncbi:aquaporin [Pestalotiopsis sp. NC0098]|nr:aquaporin [Pestalotiopsis sp. NC0098]
MRLFKSSSNTSFAGQHPHAGSSGHSKLLSKMPVRTKNHIVAAAAEFVGTFLFLFFAFGGAQTANTAPGTDDVARILYIALSFGISLLVNAWVFFRVSGGAFNPAVSLALAVAGAIDLVRLAVVVPAQLLAGIAAAAAVAWLLPGPLAVGTALAGDVSAARGLSLEIILTAELVLTIFMLAGEKHRGTFLAPVGIGLSLFICHLAGVPHTGASLNPARSFGPAVVTGTFPDHWIYWLGPVLGSLLASFVYLLIKAVDYTTVNPTQDAAEAAEDVQQQQQRPAAVSHGASSGGGAHGAVREGGHSHDDNGAGASANKDGAFERSPRLEDREGSRAGH